MNKKQVAEIISKYGKGGIDDVLAKISPIGSFMDSDGGDEIFQEETYFLLSWQSFGFSKKLQQIADESWETLCGLCADNTPHEPEDCHAVDKVTRLKPSALELFSFLDKLK